MIITYYYLDVDYSTENHQPCRYLVNKLGLRVTVVPWDYDFTQEDFDGLFLSNGPGDPTQCAQTVENVKCLGMDAKDIKRIGGRECSILMDFLNGIIYIYI